MKCVPFATSLSKFLLGWDWRFQGEEDSPKQLTVTVGACACMCVRIHTRMHVGDIEEQASPREPGFLREAQGGTASTNRVS